MNLEDKIKRHNELEKITYPSDQEIEELAQLKDEIRIELEEQNKKFTDEQSTKKDPPKQYKGIISGRIEKWRDERREKNKTTPEMLRQLELDAKRAELEARIEIAKAKKKKNKTSKLNFSIPGKIFTEGSEKDYKQLKSALGTNEKDYSIL